MLNPEQMRNGFVRGTDAQKMEEKQSERADLVMDIREYEKKLKNTEDLEERRQLKRKIGLSEAQIDSLWYEMSLMTVSPDSHHPPEKPDDWRPV